MIGRRIAALRIAAGFEHQIDLAVKLGVDRARVSDWETGKHKPTGELRRQLLEIFGISEDQLFNVEPDSLFLGKSTEVDEKAVTPKSPEDKSSPGRNLSSVGEHHNRYQPANTHDREPGSHPDDLMDEESKSSRIHAFASDVSREILTALRSEFALTPDENRLLALFRAARPADRKAIFSGIERLIGSSKSKIRPRKKRSDVGF